MLDKRKLWLFFSVAFGWSWLLWIPVVLIARGLAVPSGLETLLRSSDFIHMVRAKDYSNMCNWQKKHLLPGSFFLVVLALMNFGCSANAQPVEVHADPFSSLGPKPQTPNSSTLVPAGTMALLDYPPLVLIYDPTRWSDRSQYTDLQTKVNYLDALGLETCILGVQGPSGFFPSPDEILTLGNLRYQVTVFKDQPPGSITAFFIEDESLAGYNYQIGLPVLAIRASPMEFLECRIRAEEVLSTLQASSG